MAVAESQLKQMASEIEGMKNLARGLKAKHDAQPDQWKAEDAAEMNRLIDDGIARQIVYDEAEREFKTEQRRAGFLTPLEAPEQVAKEMARNGGHRKSWGQLVIESPEFKTANAQPDSQNRNLAPVEVGEIKAIYEAGATFGGGTIIPQFFPDILDIARQRPRSVIDLVNHSQTVSDAVQYVIMDTRNGGVVSVTITAQGSGYVQGTATVTFGAAPAGGVTATGTPTVVSGAITGVIITNPGSGYVTPPSVTFAVTGTGATGTAVLGGATVVGEYAAGQFGIKPESGMTFALQTAVVRTIATWVAASRQILDDAPRLRALIDNELAYMVEVALEDQIIGGNGTGNNFTGILNTSGIQSRVHKVSGRGFVATDNDMDTLRRAITDIRLAFYQPDGIVINPAQGEAMELTRASTAGTYMMTYDPVAMQVWRVPVVETAAMTAGTGLVGNFRLGATIWDRMATQILTGQPNDFFLRNAFAVLAELRAAFAVTRPLAFEKATGLD